MPSRVSAAVAAKLNAGFALHQRGQLDQAEALYREALGVAPTDGNALHMLGLVQYQKGEYDTALTLIGKAIVVEPRQAAMHSNLALVLQKLRRFDEALASADRALALNPAYPEALVNRGNALHALQRHEDALASYDRALAMRPDYAEVFYNRGETMAEMGLYEDALASYDRALAIRPDYPDALLNRGAALYALNRLDEAARSFARLVAVAPDHPYAMGALLRCRQRCCEWQGFAEQVAAIHAAVARGETATVPFDLLTVSPSAVAQLQCARSYIAYEYPRSPAPVWTGQRYPHRKIRVAYLSADFHNHPTSYLMAELFETHDRERFEIAAISFGPGSGGDMRLRLRRSIEQFVDVRNMSDRAVAKWLRDWEVDIAVDLKGFTTGCRTGILALRPAPIQVNYLGYPGTMGAEYIDYVVADATVIPPAHDVYYAERVVRLPDTYQVNDSKRAIAMRTPTRAEAGLPERGFVFCCFNNSYKILPDTFDVWMRVLVRVPNSVLWLLDADDVASRNLRREADNRGVAPDRLIFARRLRLEEHLARHRLADLFVDTLPCNAHTTASDALWAGLPVLTCIGSTFAGRVAASLLEAVGLPELVTHDLEEYEALALKLASTHDALPAIRARLAHNRTSWPLFDAARFRRHIESAYITMWERHQRGEAPASFTVEPIRGG